MTEKLYLEDPYKSEFEADVIKFEKNRVILDKTCFYPTSGGQPCDLGYIDGIRVVDVYKEGEEIIHVLEKDLEKDHVKGIIDWRRRFENMQQHTGQHILSQSFIEICGEDAYSTSLHIGELYNKIDIHGHYTEKEIERVENLANEIVFKNKKVRCYFAEREKIMNKLRKIPEGIDNLRVVEIEDFDLTACGGTHVRNTGEIGLIKIISSMKKGDFTRIEFVCGVKALKDYRKKNYELKRAVDLLNSQDILKEIEKVLEEKKSWIKKIRELEEELSEYEVSELIKNSEKIGEYRLIMRIYNDRDVETLVKKFDSEKVIVFLASRKNNEIVGFSKIKEINIGEIMKEAGKFIGGGGGGSKIMGKAGGKNSERIEDAFEYIKKKVKSLIG